MRALLAVLILFVSAVSFAQETRMKYPTAQTPPLSLLKGYLLNPEMRFEKTPDLDWAERKPFNIAIAYQRKQFDFVMEYASFKTSTGNATLSVDREHQELVFWGRWHVVEKKWEKNRASLYGGLGVGRYIEKVTSDASGSSSSADSDYQWMSGLSVGAEFQFPITDGFGFLTAVEGRALVGPDFDPNPMGSGVVRLGLFINL